MRKFILSFIFVLAFYSQANSQPTISGYSGTVANGNSITISGSSFGSNGPTIAIFDNFEGGVNGAYIGNGVTDATIGQWVDCGASCSPIYYSTYSTNYANSGTKSSRQDWTTDLQEGARWMGYSSSPSYMTKVYFSFWTYLPAGMGTPDYGSGPNWKVWWLYRDTNTQDDYASEITSDPPSATTIGWVDGSQNRICYPTSCAEYGAFSFTRGRWIRWEGYLVGNTSSGSIELWHTDSGQARNSFGSNTGRTLDDGSSGWRTFHLPGFARADTSSNTYYDDVYLAYGDGAQARVEIGNNATYSNCTNLSVCTVTSWSASSITATARTGSFPNGAAYLFVIDSSGNASSGYGVTIGSGGGDTTPPTVTISALIPDPSSITSDSFSINGTVTDAVGATSCKWRLTSPPDGSNGTSITPFTGGTSVNWPSSGSATVSGFSRGANTLYVGCGDSAGNWGSDSMVVNYLPVIQGVTGLGISFR